MVVALRKTGDVVLPWRVRWCKPHRLCLCVRVQILQIGQGGFEGMQEALCHGVVPTVALATHTRLHPMLPQELSIALSPILTATVRMHDEPRSGLALTGRHRH